MAYTSINSPTDYFNTKIWTGDGNTTQAITGLNFQPDLVWEKGRNLTSPNLFFDAVRGANKALVANNTNAEASVSGYLNSFDSDGFTVGNDGAVNGSGDTYVAWNWLASNTSGSSNTDGSITSTVSANTTSGFSIVKWTGNGTAGSTVGHGLGSEMKFMILKDYSLARSWLVYHQKFGGAGGMTLNTTNAADTSDNGYWNSTDATSSVFSTGTYSNENSSNYICYCFAEKKGFSKFGSYTGNGSADGAFVYTGFKPTWLMIKNKDLGAGYGFWCIWDNKRNVYNPENTYLIASTNEAEGSESGGVDFVSNGFKFRNSYDYSNRSACGYIYMAFAESPFTTSTGVPTTAR